jgi:hypothetical protein
MLQQGDKEEGFYGFLYSQIQRILQTDCEILSRQIDVPL